METLTTRRLKQHNLACTPHLLVDDVTQAQIRAQRVGGAAAVVTGAASVVASV